MVVRGLAWLLDHGGAECGVLLGWDYRPAPGKTNQAHANTANQHIVHIFKVEISSKIRRKYVIIVQYNNYGLGYTDSAIDFCL